MEFVASTKVQLVMSGAAAGGVGSKAMKMTSWSAYAWNIFAGGVAAYFCAPGGQELLGVSDDVAIFFTFLVFTPGVALITVFIEFLLEFAKLKKEQALLKFREDTGGSSNRD